MSARAAILTGVLIFALGAALGYYWLFDESSDSPSTVSLTFLLLVPAVLSAVVSYLTDRDGTRSAGHYFMVPLTLLALVLVAGVVFLQEGVICIILLTPLWLPSAIAGSFLTYGVRRRIRERGRLFCTSLLLAPILLAQAELQFPPHPSQVSITREVIIDAPPSRVWPLVIEIPSLSAHEGRWNVAQDLLGIPRPLSARLVAGGAQTGSIGPLGVRFEERLLHWQAGRSIDWAFAFPDESVREHTDQHIAPDGRHLRIARGGYRLEPLPGDRTRLVLRTDLVLRTPLNAYATWWADRLLGDIQDNVLAIVRQRAERDS